MKLKYKSLKHNIYIIFLIIIIFLYHMHIQHKIEKIFSQTYFPYTNVKRPLEMCNNNIVKAVNCLGMPSGHAETSTIVSCLLYYYNFIPLWLTIIFIFIFSSQRVISNWHTIHQVTVGIILGFLYSCIYYYFNLSIYSFLIVISIGLILSILIIHKIDKEVYGPIPEWVDPVMIPSIKKKQNCNYYIKILNLYVCGFYENKVFINWYDLEKYLDIIVNKIKNTHLHFDAVVGLKTGGAIISDYVSNKLNLINYKLKLLKKIYNCNKKSVSVEMDMIYTYIFKENSNFSVCEGIEDNLKGKNIILIDESIASGNTIEHSINYLINDKKVNLVYPICISLYKSVYEKNIDVDYVMNKQIAIWPWGYDN